MSHAWHGGVPRVHRCPLGQQGLGSGPGSTKGLCPRLPAPGHPCKPGGQTVGSAYSRLCQAIPADPGDRQQALLTATVPGCPCRSGGQTVGSAYSHLRQAIPADAGDRQQSQLTATVPGCPCRSGGQTAGSVGTGLCGAPCTFTGTQAPRGWASRSRRAGDRPRKGRRVAGLLLGFAGPPCSLTRTLGL